MTTEKNGSTAGSLIHFRMWCEKHLSERVFVLILAFVVGLIAALAAFVLHWLINIIASFLMQSASADDADWRYLVYPVVGILITMLFVRYVVKDNISHGITRILYAISTNRSRLKPHNTWTSVVASAITIGFGGSVGAEAPIVLTGSAIGSNLGRVFNLDRKTMMLLIGCGAAGAIAGIFKAPIAGLVFTVEVLMIDLTMASLLPILVSCVTATCFTYVLSGDAALFTFHLDNAWTVQRIPACLFLGAFCGLVSLYFIRMMGACEGFFARFRHRAYVRLVVGGVMLSLLIFLFPALYGEGYLSINLLLNGDGTTDWNRVLDNSLFAGEGNLLLVYIALVILTKVIATSATNGAGATTLATGNVGVEDGLATFTLALPGGILLDRPMVTIKGNAVKFAGSEPKRLTAGALYRVNKTMIDELATPLTLQAVGDGTIITITNPLTKTIAYTINGKNRRERDDASFTISINKDDLVQFYGDNTAYASPDEYLFDSSDLPTTPTYSNIKCSADCYVYGNIMSLIQSSDFAGLTTLSAPNAFFGLLADMNVRDMKEDFESYLHSHPSRVLLLPATTITPGCYAGLFAGSAMTRAPELPAMSLAKSANSFHHFPLRGRSRNSFPNLGWQEAH